MKDVVTRALAVSAVALAIAAATAGAAGAPRSLTAKCVDTSGVRAHPFWITTADRVRLYAIEAGHGPTAVVSRTSTRPTSAAGSRTSAR